ncbi:hypothetical protein D3C78_1562580 [compost metagenome]
MRSLLATMYQDGFCFQAATLVRSSKAVARIGPWVAVIRVVCSRGRSWANSVAMPDGVMYR